MIKLPRWRWVAPTAMVIGAAAAALAPAGPDGLVPFKAATAAAADGVYVAIVVDFGLGYGGSPRVASGCVRVPAGLTGYDALSAFVQQMSWTSPGYNNAGLLCAIDGYPGNGCGQVVASGYDYWSYWHGDPGTWTYSSSGASRTMQTGDVEGWRFENPGNGNPSDPPPAAASTFSSICTSAVTSTSSASTSVTATTAAPPNGTNPVGVSGSTPPGSGPSSHTSGPDPAPASPGQPVPASGSGSGSTTIVPGQSTVHPGSPSAQHPSGEALARAGSDRHQGGGSVPLLAGGFIVVVLALGAIYRWRRHPGPP